jgi:hypothetical protein
MGWSLRMAAVFFDQAAACTQHSGITVVIGREDVREPGRDQLAGPLAPSPRREERRGIHLHEGSHAPPTLDRGHRAGRISLRVRQDR